MRHFGLFDLNFLEFFFRIFGSKEGERDNIVIKMWFSFIFLHFPDDQTDGRVALRVLY